MLHPLGPLVYRVDARDSAKTRFVAALVFAAGASVLGLAAWLHPSGAGLGTHRQLGLPPCSMVALTGYPCPTCGMTTAFAHAVRGELFASFQAHPAGLLGAIATMVASGLALAVVLTGKVWKVNWYRVSPARVVIAVVLLVLGGWGYKVAIGLIDGSLPIH